MMTATAMAKKAMAIRMTRVMKTAKKVTVIRTMTMAKKAMAIRTTTVTMTAKKRRRRLE
jgi:hypothetical protein